MAQLGANHVRSNGGGFNDVVTFQNSGGTENGRLCRAWINFNGTGTVATRASFNVSQLGDNGTGDYTVTFANAMTDANYCCNVTVALNVSEAGNFNPPAGVDRTTTTVRIDVEAAGGAQNDAGILDVAIFR